MSTFEVRFEKRAQKSLKKMDPYQRNIILAWIRKNLVNTQNPRLYGKPLGNNHSGKWRYRIGDYRLISNIDDRKITILILEVGHRRDVY